MAEPIRTQHRAGQQSASSAAMRDAHWKKTWNMTVILLFLWFFTGFLSIFFARELSHLSVFGWPLSFYMAAQGSSLIYLAVVGFYAWRMHHLDRLYRSRALAQTQAPTQDRR
jgi:putative solute:sodium symporter small subunit